jgi:hypothetical protein
MTRVKSVTQIAAKFVHHDFTVVYDNYTPFTKCHVDVPGALILQEVTTRQNLRRGIDGDVIEHVGAPGLPGIGPEASLRPQLPLPPPQPQPHGPQLQNDPFGYLVVHTHSAHYRPRDDIVSPRADEEEVFVRRVLRVCFSSIRHSAGGIFACSQKYADQEPVCFLRVTATVPTTPAACHDDLCQNSHAIQAFCLLQVYSFST